MSYEERTREFKARIDAGGKIEATDWMPDQYREAALKFIEMHANSEIMGALPEREWIPRAPTLRRKLSLTAKVQDEVGHAETRQFRDPCAGVVERREHDPIALPTPAMSRRCVQDRLNLVFGEESEEGFVEALHWDREHSLERGEGGGFFEGGEVHE